MLTEDDDTDEPDGTVTLSVPAKTDQYKYIPGFAASATSTVRDNDEPQVFELLQVPQSYNEGDILGYFLFHEPDTPVQFIHLQFTEGLDLLDLDGMGASGYVHEGNGRIKVPMTADIIGFTRFNVPTLENDSIGSGGSITLEGQSGEDYIFHQDRDTLTHQLVDDDAPPTVTLVAPAQVTEGSDLQYTLDRTAAEGQSRSEMAVNVRFEQTGDYISWPEGLLARRQRSVPRFP